MKGVLKSLFKNRNGLTPAPSETDLSILNDTAGRLKYIVESRGKIVNDELSKLKAYQWLFKDACFEMAISVFWPKPKKDREYDKNAVKRLKLSGFKKSQINNLSIVHNEAHLDFLNYKVKTLKRSKRQACVTALRKNIRRFYYTEWQREQFILFLLPILKEFFYGESEHNKAMSIPSKEVSNNIEGALTKLNQVQAPVNELSLLDNYIYNRLEVAVVFLDIAKKTINSKYPEYQIKKDSGYIRYRHFVLRILYYFLKKEGFLFNDGVRFKSYQISSETLGLFYSSTGVKVDSDWDSDSDSDDLISDEHLKPTGKEKSLYKPIAIILNNNNGLKKIKLSTVDEFWNKVKGCDLTVTDERLVKIWSYDNRFLGKKVATKKYPASKVIEVIERLVEFLSHFEQKPDSTSEPKSGLATKDVRELVWKEIYKFAIDNEICNRISNGIEVPSSDDKKSIISIVC